ncbi:MAG: right-handed parallel beta-helix repeat-containing protein, partial [Bacteroidales bacterium]|nr:right-handed parallel beta-helix repeat-containing protein [Bacteroidales bacterium]
TIITLGILLSSVLISAQTIIPAGNISGIWSIENSPYLIEGVIWIPEDSCLTIQAGVYIEFQEHYQVKIKGRLKAVGTELLPIVFTISDTTYFADTTNSTAGGWDGLCFADNSTDTSIIEYCDISYAKRFGVESKERTGAAIILDHYNYLIIKNSNIHHNTCYKKGAGIHIRDYSNAFIEKNHIHHNRTYESGGGVFSSMRMFFTEIKFFLFNILVD